ncbi:arsenite methyltransferase-like [Sycon ciliatum]|uniref:arsenite methyltransferase-like n=1 Tax=Sycon ciliatum TaxID=27933 RepID=UPI0031F6C32A
MADNSSFDASNKSHVQMAVRSFHDSRSTNEDWEWQTWISPTDSDLSHHVRSCKLSTCNEELRARSCGCGQPFPDMVAGAKVLDIGCGSGVDCMVLAQLVGDKGHVVGVDLCSSLVAYAEEHAKNTGVDNVEFVCCDAEDLSSTEPVVASGPYDLIVANCSLCQMRECARTDILQQAYALLKPGGEFYICDLFVSVDVSECVRSSSKAWVEGLAGAWMWSSFLSSVEDAAFSKPILMTSRRLEMTNERRRELAAGMGVFGTAVDKLHELEDASGFQLCSATYRLFRLAPEDGRTAMLMESPLDAARLTLNIVHPDNKSRKTGKEIKVSKMAVCRQGYPVVLAKDVALTLARSRFAQFIDVSPAKSIVHLQPTCAEPFLPKPTRPGNSLPGLPGLSFSRMTIVCDPASDSENSQPICRVPNLASVLRSTPGLKELRDLVEESKNGGCGPRGC